MAIKFIKEFIKLESSAGIFLITATFMALLAANSGMQHLYQLFLDTNLLLAIGKYQISKPLNFWINDALMVIFFFLVGLELKREIVEGHLSNIQQIILPVIGALGGVIVPGIIFYLLNKQDPKYIIGWAIPTATDIAFALSILSMCSRHVPAWAKIFLLTLAIFDDLAAICIIAIFYTRDLSMVALLSASLSIIVFLSFNRVKILNIAPYVLGGLYLWVCVLQSGVHATLAGVITALFIPVSGRSKKMEKDLHPWVAFGIVPIFAFANTGINLKEFAEIGVYNSITIGIAIGLFIGKQLGIFTFSYTAIKALKIKLPADFSFIVLYGVSVVAGVGFTMSLFISSLAYEDMALISKARLGILIGTIASAACGFLILKYVFRKKTHISGTGES